MSGPQRPGGISGAFNRLSQRFSGRYTRRMLGIERDKKSRWEKFANRFAVFLVAGTFLFSLTYVLMREKKKSAGGKINLTLAHWQLEPGVRTGLQKMAEKYNALRISRGETPFELQQLPISEQGYGQWVTTNLMGGTAPDLIEQGKLNHAIWINYRARYCVPLTQDIMRPNPYNKGTALEGVPRKNTNVDAM